MGERLTHSPARPPAPAAALGTELPVFAETQLLFPELPPAPCDQRARHWLPIIPIFAYSWRRGGTREVPPPDPSARAPHLSPRSAPPRGSPPLGTGAASRCRCRRPRLSHRTAAQAPPGRVAASHLPAAAYPARGPAAAPARPEPAEEPRGELRGAIGWPWGTGQSSSACHPAIPSFRFWSLEVSLEH